MTNPKSGLLILGKCFRNKAFVGHDHIGKINFLRHRKGRVSSHFPLLRFGLLECCEMVIGLIRVYYHNDGAWSTFDPICARLKNIQKQTLHRSAFKGGINLNFEAFIK